jgi:HD-GYP domain-containing protein (c-di-GMP phosphodiesterase class II)
MPDTTSEAAPYRLAELVGVIAVATDAAIGMPMERAIEGCLVATQLGKRLGLSEDELSDLYSGTLLTMLGCTGESHQGARLFGDERSIGATIAPAIKGGPADMLRWMLAHLGEGEPLPVRMRMMARMLTSMGEHKRVDAAHCELAQMLAARLGFGPRIQAALAAVFERWDGKGSPNALRGDAIPLIARIGHVSWDIQTYYRLGGLDAAIESTRKRSGKAFDPALVEVFHRHAAEVTAVLDTPSAWQTLLDSEPGDPRMASEDQADVAASVLADFADMKSDYTTGHSRAVAALAAEAARLCGLDPAAERTVRRAGYVHDLGRVTVSTGIWDKPGALTDAEWEQVRLHPYYTERILARASALAGAAAVAGMHHERLDGSGYHRSASAAALSNAARILAAADAFQTKLEPRPHRDQLSKEAAAEALERDAEAGRLDRSAVRAVLRAAGRPPARRTSWPAGLTDREVEVLALLSRGLTMREIAARLVVSPKTVDAHIQHIYAKLEVRTKSGARLFAMEHGLADAF